MSIKKYIPIQKISIIDVVIVVLIALMVFSAQNNNFGSYVLLYDIQKYMIITLVIMMLASRQYHSFSFIKRFDLRIILLPYFCVALLSVIQAIVFKSITVRVAISENIHIIYPALLALCIMDRYKEKAVDLIWWSCVINYTFYVIIYFSKYGLGGFRFISINEMEEQSGLKTLEVNEVSFIFGILLLYLVINHKSIFKILVCAIYVFMGFKRILFAALFLTLLLYYYFRKREKKFIVWAIGLFTGVLGWLFFVNSPLYEATASLLGIELTGRSFSGKGIYGLLKGTYSMSILYLGHGWGYVANMMGKAVANGLVGTYGFHNDILKYYIDLGFIPFLLFFLNMTVIISLRIKSSVSYSAAVQYMTILTLTLICWATDNLATYPNYLLVSFLLYFVIVNKKEEDKIVDENSNCNGL